MPLEHYYNLSLLEAFAIREGYFQRVEIEQIAPARRIMELIHNAHYKPAKSASELWPLSFDHEARENAYDIIHANADEIKAWALQTKNLC